MPPPPDPQPGPTAGQPPPPAEDLIEPGGFSQPTPPDGELAPAARKHHRHNLLVTVLFQVVLRCGWIFKTESIVMPAVMNTMGASGWMRGFLPTLNRFGQSIPPLLAASRIHTLARKKYLLCLCTSVMAGCFLTLGAIFSLVTLETRWLPLVLLLVYAVFFIAVGINNLTGNTVQGKLIQVRSRGRALKLASGWGALFAILLAGTLMPGWLEGTPRFHLVFSFAGFCFAIAAFITLQLKEHKDQPNGERRSPTAAIRDVVTILRTDKHFRRLCLVGSLFSCSVMLFPHYQPMGSDELKFTLGSIVLWVMVQNAGTGVFSLVVGPVADRAGYRTVLRMCLLLIAATPLLAIGLATGPDSWRGYYWFIFLLVGLTPVVLKTLQNFTLEFAAAHNHTRYLAVMSLCLSGPLMAAPLVGLLIDKLGYPPVFLGVAITVTISWLLTFRLREPRHDDRGYAIR